KNGEIQVFRLGEKTLTDKDERKIGYHVRAKRGSLFFARCWLLIEGESEFWLLPELAKVAGFDFELEGICCVEFAQCGIDCLIKVASDFGMSCFSRNWRTGPSALLTGGADGAISHARIPTSFQRRAEAGHPSRAPHRE